VPEQKDLYIPHPSSEISKDIYTQVLNSKGPFEGRINETGYLAII